MHNQRREQFFQAQRAARVRDRVLESYILERIAKNIMPRPAGQLPRADCTSQARTRLPSPAPSRRRTQAHPGLA